MLRNAPIRAIFFDLGNTLVRFSTDFFFARLAETFGVERHFFWDLFGRRPDGLIYQYECGQSAAEFVAAFRRESAALLRRINKHRRIGARLKYPVFTDEQFLAWFTPILSFEYPRESIGLLRKLNAANYPLFILSNTNETHANYLRREARDGRMMPWAEELFSLVRHYIASCDPDLRCRKLEYDPANEVESTKIFCKALAIAGCKTSEAIFVDDILEYVKTFERMGGRGIHFRGSWTRLEEELYKFGARW